MTTITTKTYQPALTTGCTADLIGPGPKHHTTAKATYSVHLAVIQPDGNTTLYVT